MSRIGKQPITLPEKVEFSLVSGELTIKGPLGVLKREIHSEAKVEKVNSQILVSPASETREARAIWGLTRTLVNNMVHGVTKGFVKILEFNGVGYKAAVSGDVITLNLGYSHPIEYKIPSGVTAKVNKNQIELTSANKELLGFAAAKIRSFREPEPYKGKGIKYLDEVIHRKAGKTGSKK
jgi:large subunit ribosomal protein L6